MTGWFVAACVSVAIGALVAGWLVRDQYVADNCQTLGKFRSGGVVWLCAKP